jgi:hypothetical protein
MSLSPREEWNSLKKEVTDTTVKRRAEKKERDVEWEELLEKRKKGVAPQEVWLAAPPRSLGATLYFFPYFVLFFLLSGLFGHPFGIPGLASSCGW